MPHNIQFHRNPRLSGLFLILFIILSGCNHTKKNKHEAYFGGMVKNPSENYVLLYRNYIPIGKVDTFFLDQSGKFGNSIPIDSTDSFFFTNGEEFNMCLIQPGDSITFYTNTLSFDNSMQFSGTHSGFNNLILNLSLINSDELSSLSKLVKSNNKILINNYISTFRKRKKELVANFLVEQPKYKFTPKEEIIVNYSVYLLDYFIISGYNSYHTNDTISCKLPFEFSFKDTYHPVHFFLGLYSNAWVETHTRPFWPDSLTAESCIALSRKIDTMILDTLLNDFSTSQLLNKLLLHQNPPPSHRQIEDIYKAFPKMFVQSKGYARDFANRYPFLKSKGLDNEVEE